MFISVVLPAPFSPSRPRISLLPSTRSIPSLARTPPKLFEMPRISMRGVDMLRQGLGLARWGGTPSPARGEGRGSLGDRRRFVDVDAEITFQDLVLLALDHLLD